MKSDLSDLNMDRGITLLEMVVVIAIISVISVGVYSFKRSAEMMYSFSDRNVVILNDFTNVMDYLHKYVGLATGSRDNPGITITNTANSYRLRVRVDLNTPPTPGNFRDDTYVEYTFFPANHTLTFYNQNTGMYRTISSRVINITFFQPSGFPNGVEVDNFTLRYTPDESYAVGINPEIRIDNLTIFSSSYSIN